MNKICFIAGIHGVGKTTFCKELEKKLSNFKHVSASDIIKKYKSSDEFVTKKVKDINTNQLLLINGLKQEVKNSNILLDGHFVLLDKENNIKKINVDVFKKLNIDCIIILTDSPSNIQNKLNKRGNNNFNIELLKKMQDVEIEWGKRVANKLNIPYLELDLSQKEFSIKNIVQFINNERET
jgi:adenylate kinase